MNLVKNKVQVAVKSVNIDNVFSDRLNPLDVSSVLKMQVYNVEIGHTNHLMQHMTDACTMTLENAALMHIVHCNFAQLIELWIASEGQHIHTS